MSSGQHFTIVGWLAFLFLLYLWSKSKSGYHIIYAGLCLILVFLLVNNYRAIDAVMVQQQPQNGG